VIHVTLRIKTHFSAWTAGWASLSNFRLTAHDALIVVFLVDDVGVSAGLIGVLLAAGGLGAIEGTLGHITATVRFILNGVYPAGALVAGVLGSRLGVRATLWIMRGLVVAAGAFLFTPAILGRRDLPDGPEPSLAPRSLPWYGGYPV
jgi:hypothetical protein